MNKTDKEREPNDPLANLRAAWAFLEQVRNAKDDETARGTGVFRDARKWLDDAVRELLARASTAEPGMAWQPISTAPKDRRLDLLLSDGYTVFEGTWYEGKRLEHPGVPAWFCSHDKGSLYDAQPYEPTHWMPLPASPKAAAVTGEQG